MLEKIKEALALYEKKTIDISALQQLCFSFVTTYEAFAHNILSLEDEGVLIMVKARGRTTKQPSIALHYRINKAKLKKNHHQLLQHYRVEFHPAINLDDYYQQDPNQLREDLPFLKKIDHFLREQGFPTDQIPAPERSYQLVGDEKWITEKKGKELLERIGLFQKMEIVPVSEPLRFAINPKLVTHEVQYHLIVENKTTYQGLLPSIGNTSFSTLIYGSGKAIIKSIEQFHLQYPVQADHHFFYFGDIDREGISIWHGLQTKITAKLALPFYHACLQKQATKGKEYQQPYKEAVASFLNAFHTKIQMNIQQLLAEGLYYPQEILKTKELQQIWERSEWNHLK